MERPARTIARPRELVLAWAAGLLLAVLVTWPLAARLGSAGRVLGADGQFSIWNVAWVARTVVADPRHLYDANIFFPHRTTLAYSESNLLEGVAAIPVYWATRNPYASLNVVLLLSFAWAFAGMYLLVRYLTEDRGAAALAGVLYACCPYVFSHTAHIQLLMTGGIPLSMLMVHRVADAPSVRRGVLLGISLLAQGLACAYYGIFAGLMVGFATLVLAATRRLWGSRAYWTAVATGAAVSVLGVAPFFAPYLRVQNETDFARTIADAARYSANPQSYLVSSAHAHAWLLAYVASHFARWTEVLFPGILATVLGIAGLVIALRRAAYREAAIVVGGLGGLALWGSFGPAAGLYGVLFHLPLFSFLRAPSRFGLVVVFSLSVFAGIAATALTSGLTRSRRRVVAAVLVAAAIGELNLVPFPWDRAHPFPAPYTALATLPRRPLAEFPFYGERIAFPLHAQYMLMSTSHWMPLVNGYSDVIPLDFREEAPVLDSFPSSDAFAVLARHNVRYIGVHWDMYGPRAEGVRQAIGRYAGNLRELASDSTMTLYEIVRYP